jgi:hypothetical protein
MATDEQRATIIAAFQQMVDGCREGAAACRKIIEGMDASARAALEVDGNGSADKDTHFAMATNDMRVILQNTAREFEDIEHVALQGINVATEPS